MKIFVEFDFITRGTQKTINRSIYNQIATDENAWEQYPDTRAVFRKLKIFYTDILDDIVGLCENCECARRVDGCNCPVHRYIDELNKDA